MITKSLFLDLAWGYNCLDKWNKNEGDKFTSIEVN